MIHPIVHASNLCCSSHIYDKLKKRRKKISFAVSLGAFECSRHMICLSLHPPLHFSYHLTYSQRVTAIHCSPVLTHTSLWISMQDRWVHVYMQRWRWKMQTQNFIYTNNMNILLITIYKEPVQGSIFSSWSFKNGWNVTALKAECGGAVSISLETLWRYEHGPFWQIGLPLSSRTLSQQYSILYTCTHIDTHSPVSCSALWSQLVWQKWIPVVEACTDTPRIGELNSGLNSTAREPREYLRAQRSTSCGYMSVCLFTPDKILLICLCQIQKYI